jgi:hypothetical protein
LLPNIVVVPSIDAAAAEAVLLGQDGGQVVVATSAEDLQLLA